MSRIRGRRWIALAVVAAAQLMGSVDATIVSVSLPSIQRALHFAPANLTWVVNAYLISYGSCLLPAGRVGDIIGRRRVFLLGVAMFTLASVACGIAHSQALLIGARFMQGVGGAGATSAVIAIIATEFPQPAERARAMSVYSFVIVSGASLGFIAGGVIPKVATWHWIFFINVPVGMLTILFGRVWVRENAALGVARDLDILGSVLVIAVMMLTAYAVVGSSRYGWTSKRTLTVASVSCVLLGGFLLREARIRNPIMPFQVFRVPGLTASALVRSLLVAGMSASSFIGVLYLQRVLGLDVLKTGLAFLPQTIVALASAGAIARIVNRWGPRGPLLIGLLACGASMLILTRARADSSYVGIVLPALLLYGLGGVFAFMPLLVIAMARISAADAGLASGIINTSQQLSTALSLAVCGTIAAARTTTLRAESYTPKAALVGGYHAAFVLGLCLVAAALVASLFALRRSSAAIVTGRRVTS